MKLQTTLQLNTLNLRTLKLPEVEMTIEPEYKQSGPTIQILQKNHNTKPLEIDGPLF